jgi:hypothetical protein
MTLMLVLGLISLHATWGLGATTMPNTIHPANPPSDVSAPIKETPRTANTTKSDASAFAVPTKIKITAGNTVMYATMKDNRTAQEFVKLLPLTLRAFDRIGLVKSTVLPHAISDDAERTRKYSLGSIFYWPAGPEVAFCYSDHLPETVVDIIHIGMLESGVEHFQNYTGEILIELPDNTPVQTEPPKQRDKR